ncbi:hypothetical protein [Brevibacillus sp. NL20B1]|uniref:hypothetical protein n=1 Tax=Brevibacillus sp. NL20B1 TaxID=2829799 RepID=UPI001BAD488D|nr:hypothetical protein [Brevibacillus sp. NL20B1]
MKKFTENKNNGGLCRLSNAVPQLTYESADLVVFCFAPSSCTQKKALHHEEVPGAEDNVPFYQEGSKATDLPSFPGRKACTLINRRWRKSIWHGMMGLNRAREPDHPFATDFVYTLKMKTGKHSLACFMRVL